MFAVAVLFIGLLLPACFVAAEETKPSSKISEPVRPEY